MQMSHVERDGSDGESVLLWGTVRALIERRKGAEHDPLRVSGEKRLSPCAKFSARNAVISQVSWRTLERLGDIQTG